MKVTVLGTATSTGVPVVGCECNVCRSSDPRNKRTRTSVLVSESGKNLLIDTPPDFHQQALSNRITRIDAVLYTHDHADHVFGLDELRIFNFIQESPIPIYGNRKTIARIKKIFDYIWDEQAPVGGGKPMLKAHAVKGGFQPAGIEVLPVEIWHGKQTILGYRIGDFAYLTDCSGIPEASREALRGLKLLILGALRFRPHPTHFSFSAAVAEIRRLKPARALLTHLSHSFDPAEEEFFASQQVELAYDGMVVEI